METDQELVKRCLGGETRAFGELVEKYQKSLFNAALRIVDDPMDAEDVTQTAFVKAYQHLATYNNSHAFFSWIYRITINEALNHAKRQKRSSRIFSGSEAPIFNAAAPLQHRELSEETDLALGDLSPEERAIILLKHLEGFTYEEIGFIFEIPLRTVKSRLYSARQRLKNILIQRGMVHQNGY